MVLGWVGVIGSDVKHGPLGQENCYSWLLKDNITPLTTTELVTIKDEFKIALIQN